MVDTGVDTKYSKLQTILEEMKDGAVVAFSGGVDSSFLLKATLDVLGEDRVLAVTSASETIPQRELEKAKEVAREIGANHKIVYTKEMEVDDFRKNPRDRCFYCKSELFKSLWELAKEAGFSYVLEGSNYDDLGDHRPGMKAVEKSNATSPLQEAELTKEEIRTLSRGLNLPTWNKPAMACLSSRFPYGEEITPEKVTKVEKAEDLLEGLGYTQFRVRHHEGIARIEVMPGEFNRIINDASEIIQKLKELGFKFVTLDLEGFRSGSMNE